MPQFNDAADTPARNAPSHTRFLQPLRDARNALSLRKSFFAHLVVAAMCAALLSLGTLLVMSKVLQHIYNDSYGPTYNFVYDATNGTLVSAEEISVSLAEDEFVPVCLPRRPGKEVAVSELRGSDRNGFTISGSSFTLYDGEQEESSGDGSATFDESGFPLPYTHGFSDARTVMNDLQQAMWEQFVRRLAANPDSNAARSYAAVLGGIPKTAGEARRMFQTTYGTTLAMPFSYFSTSMYTPRELAERKAVQSVGYLLIVVWFALCFLVAGNRFYRSRVAAPVRLLEDAAERIGQQDLDFAVAYERADEMGRLAESFETMRASLEASQRQLWQTAEDRRQLNAAFAHDLRTPLAVLRGRLEMLEQRAAEEDASPEDIAAACERLLAQVQRLESYVETMGSLQRLDDLTAACAPVALGQLMQDLQELGETLGDAAGKRVAVCLEGTGPEGERQAASRAPLPTAQATGACRGGAGAAAFPAAHAAACGGEATSEPTFGEALLIDEPLVMEVAENLLANALRYARTAVHLTVFPPEGDAPLRIEVRDDGPGFSADALASAARPFFTEAREEGHLGVGLTTAATLCKRHGGTLDLRNADISGAIATASFQAKANAE